MGKFFILASVVSALAVGAQAVTKVACVGNSITEGYGIWDKKKYPEHLQDMLGSDYKVENFGHSSQMFHKASSQSYWNSPKFNAAYEFAPDIVVIELGTNDSKYFYDGQGSSFGYNYMYNPSYKDEMYKDYEALIDTFAHQPQAPRIIATLQPYAQNVEWGIVDTAIVNQINPLIKEVATKKGVAIIDLHSQFNKLEWLLDDVVHPNETGAKELAQIIANGIQGKSEAITSSSSTDTPAESSSSNEPSVESSSGTEALVKAHIASAKISTQGTNIFIENYSGEITVLDLNGNLVNRTNSFGATQIKAKHFGTYIIKTGNASHKVLIK